MPETSYYLRKVGQESKMTVYVRHSHYLRDTDKSSDFTRSTRVKVLPQYFDTATGRVSKKLPQHVELNDIIQRVFNDIARASRDVIGYGEEPTKEAIRKRYEEITAIPANIENDLPILNDGITSHIISLRQELADLEKQVREKKDEIAEWELINGDFDKTLLVYFIGKYSGKRSKKGIKAVAGEKNLREATMATHDTLIQVVKEFNSRWRLDEVDTITLKEFENHLLNKDYKNSTVITFVRKIKAVVKHFADAQNLDLSKVLKYKSDITDLKERNVVYLTREELGALEVMELPTDSQRRVRDIFILMAKTSLRFSDVWITKANVKGKFLEVRTKKTDKIARIPICKAVRVILERYNYTITPLVHSYFNKTIKLIGEKLSETVSSLENDEETAHKNRATTTTKGVPKYSLLSAHVARKTFVSLALASDVSPASVKGFTTHSKMDTMLDHYGNRHVNSVAEMNKVFEM